MKMDMKNHPAVRRVENGLSQYKDLKWEIKNPHKIERLGYEGYAWMYNHPRSAGNNSVKRFVADIIHRFGIEKMRRYSILQPKVHENSQSRLDVGWWKKNENTWENLSDIFYIMSSVTEERISKLRNIHPMFRNANRWIIYLSRSNIPNSEIERIPENERWYFIDTEFANKLEKFENGGGSS